MSFVFQKKFFLLVSFPVLAGLLTFYLTEQGSKISPDQGEVKVVLSEDGFGPEAITIAKGTKVIFSSSRGKLFWPASDLHPTHSLYPEFDPLEPVESQTGWSFVFEEEGVWRYHDHLAPYYTGTITVMDRGLAKETACQEQECWQRQTGEVLKKKGIEAALDLVATLYEENSDFAASCHNVIHELGHASYGIYAKSKKFTPTSKTAFCSYGFYHGFMDSLVLDTADATKARDFCLFIKGRLGSEAPDAYLQCFHGIGHGALKLSANKTRGDERVMLPSAIQFCEKAAEKELERLRCASGIFNTIASAYPKNEYGLSIRKNDPLWFCREQEKFYRGSCSISMNIALLWLTQGNLSRAGKFVEEIKETREAEQAMLNLAAASGAKNINKPLYTEYVKLCRSFQERLRLNCIQGFAFGLLEHGKPGFEYEKPIQFCSLSQLTEDEKLSCFSYISSYLAQWYREEKAFAVCRTIADKQYETVCKQELDHALEWRKENL